MEVRADSVPLPYLWRQTHQTKDVRNYDEQNLKKKEGQYIQGSAEKPNEF